MSASPFKMNAKPWDELTEAEQRERRALWDLATRAHLRSKMQPADSGTFERALIAALLIAGMPDLSLWVLIPAGVWVGVALLSSLYASLCRIRELRRRLALFEAVKAKEEDQ